MAKSRRIRAVLALLATTSLLAATACSKSETPSGSDLYKNPVTLTWWHNANTDGPAKTYWQKVANDFHALHPTVTIEFERDRDQRPAAQPAPGGPAEQRPAGHLPGMGRRRDASSRWRRLSQGHHRPDQGPRSPASAPRPASGQSTASSTACRTSFGIEGFWYNKDLFTQAGITAPPTTLDDLNADIAKLKAVEHRPDRRRRRRQVARRPLVVQLRAQGLLVEPC